MKQVRFTFFPSDCMIGARSSSMISRPLAKSTGHNASSLTSVSSPEASGTWVPCPENWNTSTSPARASRTSAPSRPRIVSRVASRSVSRSTENPRDSRLFFHSRASATHPYSGAVG